MIYKNFKKCKFHARSTLNISIYKCKKTPIKTHVQVKYLNNEEKKSLMVITTKPVKPEKQSLLQSISHSESNEKLLVKSWNSLFLRRPIQDAAFPQHASAKEK